MLCRLALKGTQRLHELRDDTLTGNVPRVTIEASAAAPRSAAVAYSPASTGLIWRLQGASPQHQTYRSQSMRAHRKFDRTQPRTRGLSNSAVGTPCIPHARPRK